MAERTCHNCLYCCCDPCLWLRLLSAGEPLLPRCANHPFWPGQLHEVPGVPCRSYRPRPATPEGDGVRMIPLTDGSYAYVDASDYEWLTQWIWHLDNGYATRYDGRKKILMHRQILPPPKGMVVDHIDGHRANNCRLNLRVCTRSENSRNRRRRGGSSSVYKGVCYNKARHKWDATCFYRGEPIWLGHFDTEVEAARAYDRKAVELFGEFARLNFPREWPPQRRAEVDAQRKEKRDEASGARGDRSVERGRVARLVPSDGERPTKRASPPPPPDDPTAPTPDPQVPGRSARARGKSKKPHAKRNAPGAERKTPTANRSTHDEIRTGHGRKP